MSPRGISSTFLASLVILAIDQITKHLVKTSMGPFDAIRVLPFLNIVSVENIGSAFGMFKSLGNTFFILVAFAAMVFVSVLIVKGEEDRPALSLILGGAAGNLVDRVAHGYVIDFLDFYAGRYHWPAFNVADSALTVGVILLAVKTLAGRKGPE